ncbi:MAG: MotA/TolQ/ExbB proton channel family protein [Planctomycetes bacterium]|nr:MotA/TolQ/ExbB proton channel family protein [Planctomycetota bacterium]
MRRIHRMLWTAGLVVAVAGRTAWAADGEARTMFEQFIWPGGGLIGLLLIVMNVVTWALIAEAFLAVRRDTICPPPVRREIADLFARKAYREAIEVTAVEGSFLAYVLHTALTEAAHGYAAMERAAAEAVEQRTTQLLRKVEVLNIIGNVAPMLGLMGTVLGMILAFNAIVAAGGVPDAPALADSIGIALVTTFWGLVVAVPALAAYSVVRNRIDALAAETTVAADELLSTFRPAGKTA